MLVSLLERLQAADRLHGLADRCRQAGRVAGSRVGEASSIHAHHLHLEILLDLCDGSVGVNARVVGRNTLDLEALRLQPRSQCIGVSLGCAVLAEGV